MEAAVLAVALAINLVAIAAGVGLGIWVAKQVPISMSLEGLPGVNEHALKVSMWMVRLFVFLLCVVMISTPVSLLTRAVLGP